MVMRSTIRVLKKVTLVCTVYYFCNKGETIEDSGQWQAFGVIFVVKCGTRDMLTAPKNCFNVHMGNSLSF